MSESKHVVCPNCATVNRVVAERLRDALSHVGVRVGQRIEELAPNLDFICPMVYPSGYHKGIPGYPNPVLVPGKVVSTLREEITHIDLPVFREVPARPPHRVVTNAADIGTQQQQQ